MGRFSKVDLQTGYPYQIDKDMLNNLYYRYNNDYYIIKKIKEAPDSDNYHDLWLVGKDLTYEERQFLASVSSTAYQKVIKCCWNEGHTKDGYNRYYGYFLDKDKYVGFRHIIYDHKEKGISSIEDKVDFIKKDGDTQANVTFKRKFKGEEKSEDITLRNNDIAR